MKQHTFREIFVLLFFVVLLCFLATGLCAGDLFTARDVLATRRCVEAEISPDGSWIAYVVGVPREAGDKPGRDYQELYLVSTRNGVSKPFVTGKVNVTNVRWSTDGSSIGFITKRGEAAKKQVWSIPLSGGEAVQVTHSDTDVTDFAWHPISNKIAYIAAQPKTKKEKLLEEKGYGFTFYEENLEHKNLYMASLDGTGKDEQLTRGKTVWHFVFSPDGKTIAAAVTDKNLVDHRYMFQEVYVLDVASGKFWPLIDPPGKLGKFAFSPDGTRLVYTAALEQKDHAVSQVYVIDMAAKRIKNLTEPDFLGHVTRAGWKDNRTIYYQAGEGVWNTLSLVPAQGGKRKIVYHAEKSGIVFRDAAFTKDFKHGAVIGGSAQIPADVFYWRPGKELKRLTRLNPWLASRKLGRQEVVCWPARDGLKIEGLLVYPVDFMPGQRYPLVVVVHGGPESHYYNSWVTSYSRPVQVLAGKGYLVFLPNYRASTGYGVKFALAGYHDAAGKEFDDIADGIDFLVEKGSADRERVGLGGGSYGGFAAAWFASYYTRYVRAVCMFVGISDLVSKRGTTDIPYEELYVHSGEKLEQMWQLSLERSPIYHAHQSKTAVLILGGEDDSRVHPSQSLEFYRRLKMNDHPAVRLVRYPGEGHGNRKQPGRIDLLFRILQWYDWYVRDKKPLGGPLPPLDISDRYGLKLDG